MRGESGDDDRVTQRSRDREIEQAAGEGACEKRIALGDGFGCMCCNE